MNILFAFLSWASVFGFIALWQAIGDTRGNPEKRKKASRNSYIVGMFAIAFLMLTNEWRPLGPFFLVLCGFLIGFFSTGSAMSARYPLDKITKKWRDQEEEEKASEIFRT